MVDLLYHDNTSAGKLRISISLEKPQSMRKCGYEITLSDVPSTVSLSSRYLYCCGKHLFKEWKSRFFALVQATQFEFALQYYPVRDTQPKETIMLDNTYSVDYIKEGICATPTKLTWSNNWSEQHYNMV